MYRWQGIREARILLYDSDHLIVITPIEKGNCLGRKNLHLSLERCDYIKYHWRTAGNESEPIQVTKITIISDGKPGHLNQSYGLADAIQRLNPQAEVNEQPALPWFRLVGRLMMRSHRFPQTDLLIGAGHRTHLTLLVIGWLLNARTLVLMKPSFPLAWFSLCFVPEHDQVGDQANNVIDTVGALNRMQPGVKVANKGLILIGGPSKHFGWNAETVVEQIERLLNEQNHVSWRLTTSRRTPGDLLDKLGALSEQLDIFPVEQTPPGWLVEQLADAEYCWVTEDSVSMIYESLSAGCKTGLIALPDPAQSRIQRGLAKLRATGRVMTLDTQLNPDIEPLSEADRCAELLQNKGWL